MVCDNSPLVDQFMHKSWIYSANGYQFCKISICLIVVKTFLV